MNLVEIQENLKGVPDDYLKTQVQQPDGSVPQFMALAELQRRQDMRARFAQPAPTTTVAQDVLARSTPSQPQGIAGAGPQPNNHFAGGGLVGYAGGGSIFNYDNYLSNVGQFEGQGSYHAKNPLSTARGKYQFLDSTWRDYAKRLGLDPNDRSAANQEKVMQAYTSDSIAALSKAGYEPTPQNVYAMHFLGQQGGGDFIKAVNKNPGGIASDYFSPEVLRANPAMFANSGTTLLDVYDMMNNAATGKRVPFRDQLDRDIMRSENTRKLIRRSMPGPVTDDMPGWRQIAQTLMGMGAAVPAMIGETAMMAGEVPSRVVGGAIDAGDDLASGIASAARPVTDWLTKSPNERAAEAAAAAGVTQVSDNTVNLFGGPAANANPWGMPVAPPTPASLDPGGALSLADDGVTAPLAKQPVTAGASAGEVVRGQPTDELISKLVSLYDSMATPKEDRKNMALLEAGLGIMGGTSPWFGVNVGQGALPAVRGYQERASAEKSAQADALRQHIALVDMMNRAGREDRRLALDERQTNSQEAYNQARIDYYKSRASAQGGAGYKQKDLWEEVGRRMSKRLELEQQSGMIIDAASRQKIYNEVLAQVLNERAFGGGGGGAGIELEEP